MEEKTRSKKNREKDWVGTTRNELKRKSTFYERIVFNHLVKCGLRHVIKQFPIKVKGNRYFLDLYIRSRKIAIEVDGGYHNTEEQKTKDFERDMNLRRKGINTLRITNEETLDREKLDSLYYKIITFGIEF